MRCHVYNCIHNNGEGYCENSSYVIIDENGECTDMLVREKDTDVNKGDKK